MSANIKQIQAMLERAKSPNLSQKQDVDLEKERLQLEATIKGSNSIKAVQPSLPEGVEEAEQKYVETCECPPANQEEECMVYEAYKAGWAARDAQFSKLLGDMDEAAVAYSKQVSDGHNYRDLRVGFIAGAKWMKAKMMEDAVEGKVFMSFAPGHDQMVMADVDLPTNTKVKVIIVKEDEL